MKNNRKNLTEDSGSKFSIKVLPIGLILLIVPLIVYLKVIDLKGITYETWTGVKQYTDFFSYYKSVWLMVFTFVTILFAAYYIYFKKVKIKIPYLFIPLAAYFILAFLSASFSEYKDVSFKGFTDRYEGFFVIMCYVLLCLITSLLVTKISDIKTLFTCLFISLFIMSLLGVSQFFGFDFLQTTFGKYLMLPNEYYRIAETLKFNFPIHYIYSTLYNPNYVGSYFSMLFPICIIAFTFSRNLFQRILSGIFAILAFINMLGCLSTAGYIGNAFALLTIVILLRKKVIKNIIPLLCLAVVFAGCGLGMNIASNGAILSDIGIGSLSTPKATPSPTSDVKQLPCNVTDIKINKENIIIDINDIPLKVNFSKEKQTFYLTNAENVAINLLNDQGSQNKYSVSGAQYVGLTLIVNGNLVTFQSSNTQFNVMISNEGFSLLNHLGKPIQPITADSIGFKGKEMWGSTRGYIWSRSLPMIKDTILLGHGPDSYAIYFPQNDSVAKLKYLSGLFTLVDKPHNMYIQMAINTGVLSLVAFLIFVLIYIVSSIKLYFKPEENNSFYVVGIASLVAVIGFLSTSMFNDSAISVSPIFWILLGIGIACNRIYKHSIAK